MATTRERQRRAHQLAPLPALVVLLVNRVVEPAEGFTPLVELLVRRRLLVQLGGSESRIEDGRVPPSRALDDVHRRILVLVAISASEQVGVGLARSNPVGRVTAAVPPALGEDEVRGEALAAGGDVFVAREVLEVAKRHLAEVTEPYVRLDEVTFLSGSEKADDRHSVEVGVPFDLLLDDGLIAAPEIVVDESVVRLPELGDGVECEEGIEAGAGKLSLLGLEVGYEAVIVRTDELLKLAPLGAESSLLGFLRLVCSSSAMD